MAKFKSTALVRGIMCKHGLSTIRTCKVVNPNERTVKCCVGRDLFAMARCMREIKQTFGNDTRIKVSLGKLGSLRVRVAV